MKPAAPTTAALTILALAAWLTGCAGPVEPQASQTGVRPEATRAPPSFPSRASIAAGQAMPMRANDPMGALGTMTLMAEAPGCAVLRGPDSAPPLNLRDLAGRVVTPVFALRPAACPTASPDGVPYLALDRAVRLPDGFYAVGGAYECFLPHGGGGQCRPVGR